MQLTPEQVRHLKALRAESPTLAVINAKIAALGGEMLPLRHRRRAFGDAGCPHSVMVARLYGSHGAGPLGDTD